MAGDEDKRHKTDRRTDERRASDERRLNLAFRAYSDDMDLKSGRRAKEYRKSSRRNDSD